MQGAEFAGFDLDQFEERAAIMEFDGGMSREDAERWARIDLERIRRSSEARYVAGLPGNAERAEYLAAVASKRGPEEAQALRVAAWNLINGG